MSPTTRGQKYGSWRRAAAWNVIACTEPVPDSVVERAQPAAHLAGGPLR